MKPGILSRRQIILVAVFLTAGLAIPYIAGGAMAFQILLDIPASHLWMLFALVFMLWNVNTMRLFILLKERHSLPGWVENLRIYLAVEFAAKCTPLGAAAPATAITLLKRYHVTPANTLAAITTTATLDAAALLVILLICSVTSGTWSSPGMRPVLATLASCILVLLLLAAWTYFRYFSVIRAVLGLLAFLHISPSTRRRFSRAALRYHHAVSLTMRLPRSTLALSFLLSLGYWLLYLSTLSMCAWALGMSLNWFLSATIQIGSLSGGQILMTPGGSGGTEAISNLMLNSIFDSAPAAALVLLWRAMTFYLYLAAGGVCLVLSARFMGKE